MSRFTHDTAPQPIRWGTTFRLLVMSAGFIVAGLTLWILMHLLLLAFAAVLVAVLLSACAGFIDAHSPIKGKWALTLMAILLTLLLLAFALLLGSEARMQIAELLDRLPDLLEAAQNRLGVHDITSWLGDEGQQLLVGDTPLLSRFAAYSSTFLRALIDVILVVFAGVYIAVNPGLYRSGLIRLTPPAMRARTEQTLSALYRALRLWLWGQLLAMGLVGTLVSLGLWLLGVPSALALGLIAGGLEFVPILGPFIAAVPGIAIALSLSPELALWTLLVYVLVQQTEGNLITPLVQKEMVRLPPALTIFAIIAFGLLFGPLGILFATPLTVVTFVLVEKLWIRDTLCEHTLLPGEDEPQT